MIHLSEAARKYHIPATTLSRHLANHPHRTQRVGNLLLADDQLVSELAAQYKDNLLKRAARIPVRSPNQHKYIAQIVAAPNDDFLAV